jgi:esterase/lipase superfamily enzyme
MSFDHVDPAANRKIDGWHSPILGLPMPIVSYGHSGRPLLLFPTAAADFLENERFFLIKSLEPAILGGQVRVFSIDSINRVAWMDPSVPVPEQARRQALYARYVEDEVVPYVRHMCGNPSARVAAAGASFGAFHAANSLFRRPDLFDALIGMMAFTTSKGRTSRVTATRTATSTTPCGMSAISRGRRSKRCSAPAASSW